MGMRGSAFFCVDNSQVVQSVDSYLSGSPPLPPSDTTQGTWQAVLHDVLDDVTFNVGIGWLKAHVRFPGNDMADALAKYTLYALRVQLHHRQPPSLHSITFSGSPTTHKLGGAHRKSLYPQY